MTCYNIQRIPDFKKNLMHEICWEIWTLNLKNISFTKYPYLKRRVRAALFTLKETFYQHGPMMMVCLPVFGYEGFDAINFPLLISLLLGAQRLFRVWLHITFRNQHFVWHRKLKTEHKETLQTDERGTTKIKQKKSNIKTVNNKNT